MKSGYRVLQIDQNLDFPIADNMWPLDFLELGVQTRFGIMFWGESPIVFPANVAGQHSSFPNVNSFWKTVLQSSLEKKMWCFLISVLCRRWLLYVPDFIDDSHISLVWEDFCHKAISDLRMILEKFRNLTRKFSDRQWIGGLWGRHLKLPTNLRPFTDFVKLLERNPLNFSKRGR